jgi:hypothetical protein
VLRAAPTPSSEPKEEGNALGHDLYKVHEQDVDGEVIVE